MGPRALPMGLKIGLNSIAMPFFGFFLMMLARSMLTACILQKNGSILCGPSKQRQAPKGISFQVF